MAIAGTILSYVWRVQDLYPVLRSLQYPTLISLAALGLYLLDGDRRRNFMPANRQPTAKLAWFLFVLMLVAGVFSIAKGHAFHFVKDDMGKTIILMGLIASSVRTFRDVERYAFAMVGGAFLYALYVNMYVTVGAEGRLGNLITYDANDLGCFLVSVLPLTLYFAVRGRTVWLRVAAVIALLLFGVVIIKSGSRGAFLGLIGVALYVLLGFSAVPKRTRIVALACGVAFINVMAGEHYWKAMGTLLNPQADYNWSSDEGTGAGRMDLWKRGVGYMLQNPLTGVGPRAFPIAEGRHPDLVKRQSMGIGVKWSAAHNSFVQVGAEIGILGLTTFLALLVVCYRIGRGAGTPEQPPAGPTGNHVALGHAFAGSVIGFAISGFFVSQAYSAFIFVLFGIMAGFSKVRAPKRHSEVRRGASGSNRAPGRVFRAKGGGARVPVRLASPGALR